MKPLTLTAEQERAVVLGWRVDEGESLIGIPAVR